MVARSVIAAAVLATWLGVYSDQAAAQDVSLAQAVREFNKEAKENPVGKGQPPLTEDGVAAAIQGWIRERIPATDDVYGAFQKVAHTGALPPGADLSFTTGWRGFNGFDFDVWWVDLTLPVAKGAGYTYRIRDQKLASRPSKK